MVTKKGSDTAVKSLVKTPLQEISSRIYDMVDIGAASKTGLTRRAR